MSSVLLYCWKGRKKEKTSVPTPVYDEVEIDKTVSTDSNPVVIYDEVQVNERVIDLAVPITDNPAYGSTDLSVPITDNPAYGTDLCVPITDN